MKKKLHESKQEKKNQQQERKKEIIYSRTIVATGPNLNIEAVQIYTFVKQKEQWRKIFTNI